MPEKKITLDLLVNGVLKNDRSLLSRAITLLESNKKEHIVISEKLIDKCYSYAGRSVRVGITGAPGAGKSTFIEALGSYLADNGHHVAVLAIDPSSEKSKGSILGDKTRMNKLSAHKNAFIRPSPSGTETGGVARATRESIILCEAAGYDAVLIETVGVGQSEIAARSMVDFFLLLVQPGAGDELQGIKRGIMEMADAVIVNKADGYLMNPAKQARAQLRNAVSLFHINESGWQPRVELCSSLTGEGIEKAWVVIKAYLEKTKNNGYFQKNRQIQELKTMYHYIEHSLKERFYSDKKISNQLKLSEKKIVSGKSTAIKEVQKMMKEFYGKELWRTQIDSKHIGILLPVVFFFLFNSLAFPQIAPNKYRVEFTDKKNSPYSISNPSAFISQRAIQRRFKQNIPVIENDLPVNSSYIDSVLKTGAVTLLNPSKWMNAITISTTDTVALTKIRNFPFVKNVKSNTAHTPAASLTIPLKTGTIQDKLEIIDTSASENIFNSSSSSAVVNVFNYGQAANQTTMINADYLHNNGLHGEGILIAILDAGFAGADTMQVFEQVRKDKRVVATKDFIDGDNNVYEKHTHGTNVFSTMGAWYPGIMIGTAPFADYLLLISEDVTYENLIEEDNWVAAVEYADSAGVDVINSSLGYTEFDNPAQNHKYSDMNGNSTIVTNGADMAAAKGILVVNSAGNSGGSSWQYISAPADGDSVLAIGAVDANGNYASFSSTGPSYDGRIKPDICAQGKGTTVAYPGGVGTGSGTSFSSPVIAGAAASLWQANRNKTNMEVLKAIRQSASKFLTPDSLYGYGIPDFKRALKLFAEKPVFYPTDEHIVLAPNPYYSESDKAELLFFSLNDQSVVVDVVDIRGRLVYHTEANALKGRNKFNLSPALLYPQGIYIIFATTSRGNSFVTKLVKL